MGFMTAAARRNASSLKSSCASTTCSLQKTCAMHCSNTLSNKMIVSDRLARKIVSTIRQFLSSSGIDECCDKRLAVIAKVNRRDLPPLRQKLPAAEPGCNLVIRAHPSGTDGSDGLRLRP